MGRIVSIDYGRKRTGIAVSDPEKIIANGLCTIATEKLFPFLKEYFLKEPVEKVIIGMPVNWDDTDTHATPYVRKFIAEFIKRYPSLPIVEVDERFTSRMATQAMLEMGMKKKHRQDKSLVDQIAATIMLQEFLQHHV